MVIRIRPAMASDAAVIARIRVDCWRVTYRGLVPDAYLDGMDVEASVELWKRVLSAAPGTVSIFVADRDGEVVGFGAGNRLTEPRHELDAELTAVYVRRDYQRGAVGRRLVCAVAKAQRAHGANGLIVWVIAGNKGARAFYEALGATLLVEQPFDWDGMPLTEAGYGFRDIDTLLAACEMPPGPQGSLVH
jgi:ribosomal protein S18 acetylase RimI-like enzyme